jgi:hypothetical protein
MRAVEIILKELADSVIDGKTGRSEVKGEEPQQPRRRSPRATFRAEEHTDETLPPAPDANPPETVAAQPA